MNDQSRILTITERALARLEEIRRREPDADELGLLLEVVGVRGTDYAYEMHLVVLDLAPADAVVERHGDLHVVVPADSVEKLRGAVVDLSRDLLDPTLRIDNPNKPSPTILGEGPPPDPSSPVAEQVAHVIERQINPAIAAHGGSCELVAVEDQTAYVRLGGGCVGCGLASVTLSQGIEATIVALVPEISKVVDVTDHAAGTNPYYEPNQKK
ncbi:MAG TPA: hypothetical protein ENK55_03025 [Actinobacteria bacterium]|nr:hypothetical protein [Actinomycetota bacterium]